MSVQHFYSDSSFAIDLIADTYKTDDINEIYRRCNTELNIPVCKSEIYDYLNRTDDLEKKSNSIQMKDHFKEEEYA